MCFLPKRERVQKLSLSLLTGTLIALPSVTKAEVIFGYGTEKEFIQTTASGPRFDGGNFGANLRDGNAIVSFCPLNGSLFAFGADPLIGCNTGSTGIVSGGDINNDGVLDDNTYWEVLSVIRATTIEPFHPELCKLVAAPASPLPRPLSGFNDLGVSVFWNTQSVFMQRYDISWYDLNRPYGDVDSLVSNSEGSQMLKECVPGQYVFQFPALGNIDLPRNILVRLYPFLEAYDSSTGDGRKGFKFLGNRWDSDGYYELDPRLLYTFSWQSPKNKLVLTDKLFFSITADQEPTPDDGVPNQFFPPDGDPVYLSNIQSTSYTLPPGFFHVGQTGTARLQYFRSLGVSAISFDSSSRAFKMPVRFVETYEGYSAYEGVYPPVTTANKTSAAKLMAATGDFDSDGLTNITEFGLMSDPAGKSLAISSISSTASTFTITVPNHGRVAGDAILIEGAAPEAYNGAWTIASVTATTITVNSTLNPGVAVTTGTVRRLVGGYPVPIISITSTPLAFTITARNHGKSVGDEILIAGNVSKGAYKGLWTVSRVTTDQLLGDVIIPGTITVTSPINPGPATGGVVKLTMSNPTAIDDPDVPGVDGITSTATNFTIISEHTAEIGDIILIQGATPAGYNGLWTVTDYIASPTDAQGNILGAGAITVSSKINLGAGGGGTVQQFVPDVSPVTVFDGEFSGETYVRVHDGGVIRITMLKRPTAGESISYGIETKATAATKKWSKIKFGSTWKIVSEDAGQIVIESDGTVPLTTLVRPAVTQKF